MALVNGLEIRAFANLRGADLTGADLRGADLEGAYLTGANLRGAYLRGAYLRGADLTGADLTGADLRGANLTGANLTGANLTGTIYGNDIPIMIQTEFYAIVKCKRYIQIGCMQFTPDEWRSFTDTEIDDMDSNALKFWKKYKNFLLKEVDVN